MSNECNFIEIEHYLSAGNKKFYYVRDIKYTLKKLGLDNSGKKGEVTNRLDIFYKSLRRYQSNIKTIINIQRRFRDKKNKKYLFLKGPGYLDKNVCVNDEDFLTFEHKDEINNDYFISYRDNTGVVFFFDVRSLDKLLKLNKSNPYTTEPFPKTLKSNVTKLISNLKKDGTFVEHEDSKLTEDQIYKARVVNIFQTIDELDIVAGGANPNWFLDLNFKKIKDFYRVIEDIWNYRAELTETRKSELVPTRKILNINPKYIIGIKDVSEKISSVKNYLLNEMEEMITSSDNIDNRKTCALFILTAFTEINPQTAEALPWLVQN